MQECPLETSEGPEQLLIDGAIEDAGFAGRQGVDGNRCRHPDFDVLGESRFTIPVSMLAAAIFTLTDDCSGCSRSTTMVPLNLENLPFAVPKRCRTLNAMVECAGSIL